jgi:hypothetical protein
LPGGNVWRVGATVRKPTAPWGEAMQALLAHFAAAGFDKPVVVRWARAQLTA